MPEKTNNKGDRKQDVFPLGEGRGIIIKSARAENAKRIHHASRKRDWRGFGSSGFRVNICR